jgi:serine/threonine protein kinase
MLMWEGVPGVKIEGVLGRGASSVVYLGTQERFGRKVAVKVLHPTLDDAREKLFRTECSTLGRFASHPNILTLFDAGVLEDGSPFLVTEYLPAGTVAGQLSDSGPIAWQEVVGIGVQLAGALESTHREGVVHGDIKPHNILIGRMGQPVLGDFGVARVSAGTSASTLTAVTPLYAAPELFERAEPSVASDLYALAACLFELLDGRPAFGDPDDSPLVVVRRIADGERRPMRDCLGPAALCELLERSMDERPERRPASALEMGDALRGIELCEAIPQTPMPVMAPLDDAADIDHLDAEVVLPARITLGVRDRPRRWWMVPVGVASLLVVAAVAWLLPRPGDDRDVRAGPDTSAVASVSTSPSSSVGEPSTSTTLPTSRVAGVQPGVEVVEGATDESPELAEALREESLIFLSLAPRSTEIAELPYYGLVLVGLPARFRYQAFNPASPDHCRGMMTHELQLDALWERGVLWPGGRVQAAVGRLASEEEAHELYTAISLATGVRESGCDGMATFGPASFDEDFRVVQRDLLLNQHLAPSVTYNTWMRAGATFDGVSYPYQFRMVVEHGPYVVDLALFDDGTFPMPRDEAVGSIVTQILERL